MVLLTTMITMRVAKMQIMSHELTAQSSAAVPDALSLVASPR